MRLILLAALPTRAATTMAQMQTATEKAIAAKERDWRLTDRMPYRTSHVGCAEALHLRFTAQDGVSIVSALGKAVRHPSPDMGVTLCACETSEYATEMLKLLTEGPPKPDGIVRDLGDAAYIWTGSPHGTTGIKIRVGRIFIQIGGPSQDVAMRFAQLVTAEVQEELKKAGETQ